MSCIKTELAIVGTACHFPGAVTSEKDFWEMLMQGRDGITEVPSQRWSIQRYYSDNPERPGKSHVARGGFLQEDITQFDPLFFGISPKDAECMGPQQRLLLETTWEAIEGAGIPLAELQQQTAGVFIGGFCMDNLLPQFSPFNREWIDASSATSPSMTMLSNRMSHVFDLKGPSIFGAEVLMDEAHSILLTGTNGRGICDEQSVLGDIDYLVLTFSKGFGGIGGAVLAKKRLPAISIFMPNAGCSHVRLASRSNRGHATVARAVCK